MTYNHGPHPYVVSFKHKDPSPINHGGVLGSRIKPGLDGVWACKSVYIRLARLCGLSSQATGECVRSLNDLWLMASFQDSNTSILLRGQRLLGLVARALYQRHMQYK